MKGTILIYNNRTGIAEKIEPFLKTEDIACNVIQTLAELKTELRTGKNMLTIIDAKLDENGFGEDIELIVTARKESKIPLLVISKQDAVNAKIMALDAGADDYVTAECSTLELLARVKAQIRHYNQLKANTTAERRVLSVGGLLLDEILHKVTVNGREITLTPTEYDILHLLMENPGRVFSNGQIYELIWKAKPIGTDNTIAVHIRHLRKKIEEDPSNPQYLCMKWGQGYYMDQSRGEIADSLGDSL